MHAGASQTHPAGDGVRILDASPPGAEYGLATVAGDVAAWRGCVGPDVEQWWGSLACAGAIVLLVGSHVVCFAARWCVERLEVLPSSSVVYLMLVC